MFYWKYSANRIFFINEYYLFVPLAIGANYIAIRKIRLRRQRMKELEKLQKQLEREKQIRRITLVSLGLSLGIHLLAARGGAVDDILDVEYIRETCDIEEGVRYLDHSRLRKIIHDLYRYKRKGRLIFITATALCHLANRYGVTFLDLPFAVGDFGLTNVYQTFRKALVTIFLGAVPILLNAGGRLAVATAVIIGTAGLRLAFSNLDFIPTSLIDETISATDLKPRIPGQYDVIVLNNRDKITMKHVETGQKNPECWLPDQRVFNRKCNVKPTYLPEGSDLISPNVRYDETVNMQDVTGLTRTEFSDKADLGKIKSSVSNLRKGKEVHFLEKFSDSGIIDSDESWDIHENECIVPEKRFLRTRNEL